MLKMKAILQKLWERMKRERLISSLIGGSLLIILIAQAAAFWFLRGISGPLVLHYTYDGIDQFGSLWQLQGYGVVGLVIVIINYFIAIELESRDWFWGRLVAAMTLLLSVLLFIAFQAIISVN